MAKKDQPGEAMMSGKGRRVNVIVLPTNVALVSPGVERLGPLQPYEQFLIEDSDPAQEQPGSEVSPDSQPSTCSAFPAGLVPRFKAELRAAGYQVVVTDRRRFEEGFRVNKPLCRDSHGEERAFLRAVQAAPLGQVLVRRWDDMYWRVERVCRLYPRAWTLIVAGSNFGANMLHVELHASLGDLVTRLTSDYVPRRSARCLVTTPAWLPRLRPRAWDVLLLVVFHSRVLSEATYRGVLRLRVPRVYALVGNGLRLGRTTGLRLEAMAGSVIREG